MRLFESVFRGFGGRQLFYRRWRPEIEPRAIVAIVHGIGEHCGRYETVVEHLTGAGFLVFGFDHRGHGRSPGQRGHIGEWSEYREDVGAFLRMIAEQVPDKPLFLMGHSMGALVVLDCILRQPDGLNGAIASAAPLQPGKAIGPAKKAVLRFLSRVCPRFPLRVGLNRSDLSRDPEVVEGNKRDPLLHGWATARWAAEMLSAIDWVGSHAAGLKLPLLLIHGEEDRIAAAEGSRRFFEAAPFADKEIRVYPESRHEPHNDLDREQVMKDIEQWLEKHL